MKTIIFTLVLAIASQFVSAQTYSVTFSVDVSQFEGTVSEVKMNGGLSGWQIYNLTNTSGSIWEVTAELEAMTSDYRYEIIDADGGWHPEWPNNDASGECFINGNMRGLVVEKDSVMNTVCWESCTSCVVAGEKSIESEQLDCFINGSGAIVIEGLKESAIKVSLYDIQGLMVMNKTLQVEGAEFTVGLPESLHKGIYIAAVETATSKLVKKLLID